MIVWFHMIWALLLPVALSDRAVACGEEFFAATNSYAEETTETPAALRAPSFRFVAVPRPTGSPALSAVTAQESRPHPSEVVPLRIPTHAVAVRPSLHALRRIRI